MFNQRGAHLRIDQSVETCMSYFIQLCTHERVEESIELDGGPSSSSMAYISPNAVAITKQADEVLD